MVLILLALIILVIVFLGVLAVTQILILNTIVDVFLLFELP